MRVDNLMQVFNGMYEAGRYPVSIYPPWLYLTLTFLESVAFAVTVPAEAIISRLTWPNLVITLALAAVLLTLSRRFWRYGLRHYSGASA